eukprot:6200484-Pleurochrysis_carterae.AAC.5
MYTSGVRAREKEQKVERRPASRTDKRTTYQQPLTGVSSAVIPAWKTSILPSMQSDIERSVREDRLKQVHRPPSVVHACRLPERRELQRRSFRGNSDRGAQTNAPPLSRRRSPQPAAPMYAPAAEQTSGSNRAEATCARAYEATAQRPSLRPSQREVRRANELHRGRDGCNGATEKYFIARYWREKIARETEAPRSARIGRLKAGAALTLLQFANTRRQ